jgi:uncharacterized membrane protein
VTDHLSIKAAWCTWLCYVLLLLQQAVDAWVQGAPWIVWLFKLLPLLLFLPGMLQDNLRSFIWVCFVSLLYFIVLVQRLFLVPGDTLAVIGTVAVVCLFTAAMFYVRWRARELRQTDNGPPLESDV